MARPDMKDERPEKLNRSERPKRSPMGKRDKLKFTGLEPGWHYCVVNDDNCPDYEDHGYEFVTHEVRQGGKVLNEGSQIGSKVSKPVGNGVTGYLMRIREEDFNEDMEALEAETSAREATMHANLNSTADGRYGKVDIEQQAPKTQNHKYR